MEFGDYYDNFEALQFAQRQIHMGRVQEGLEVLRGLRNHILRTSDTKSERYLLPNIGFYENAATEDGGFTCFETRPISARTSWCRKLTAMIGRYVRSAVACATTRKGSAKGHSYKAIRPFWLVMRPSVSPLTRRTVSVGMKRKGSAFIG